MADGGRRAGGRVGTWDAAARRRRALAWPDAFRASAAPPSASATGRSPTPARAGCCRGCRSPSASASSLYFTAEREPALVGGLGLAALCCVDRHSSRGSGRSRFPSRSAVAAVAAGFAIATLKTVAGRASGPGAAGLQRRRRGLRRGARGARAHRPHRGARAVARRHAPRARSPSACGSRCEGHGAAGRHLRRVQARLNPPLAPLRPGGYDFARDLYFQGIGATGFVLGAIKHRRAAGAAGAVAALRRRRSRACATAIDARIRAVAAGRQGRDRLGADHRQARRDLGAGQRRHVHLGPRATCCRSPAITWRWWRASCSSCCARCSR